MHQVVKKYNSGQVSFSTLFRQPDSSLSPDSSPPKLVKLRHPKTDKSAVFLLSGDSHLHEVLTFSEDHRSWFLGERVASDGRLYLVTRMDPLFLVLPYLARAERLVPLSQMLDDDLYPSTDVLSNVAGLDKVADTKGAVSYTHLPLPTNREV